MSWQAEFLLVFGGFAALMLAGLWVPFAIGVSALVFLYANGGWASFNALGLVGWTSTNSFTLTSIPMFILMAEIMLQSGLSRRLYVGLSRIFRLLPGGLLQVNVAGCAVFAAISGSSVATAAAIGTVALPQLVQRNYDRKMSAGSLAAGGTLGILIPPSIAMIIYGTFTETSIAKLFMAGTSHGDNGFSHRSNSRGRRRCMIPRNCRDSDRTWATTDLTSHRIWTKRSWSAFLGSLTASFFHPTSQPKAPSRGAWHRARDRFRVNERQLALRKEHPDHERLHQGPTAAGAALAHLPPDRLRIATTLGDALYDVLQMSGSVWRGT